MRRSGSGNVAERCWVERTKAALIGGQRGQRSDRWSYLMLWGATESGGIVKVNRWEALDGLRDGPGKVPSKINKEMGDPDGLGAEKKVRQGK